MGLRSLIAGAVDTAWSALGDIPSTVILRRVTKAYNPATGMWTDTNTDYTLVNKGILLKMESFEIDKINVLSTDRKLILKSNDLPITPNITSDRILVGVTIYNVVRFFTDPAGATVTLQLRMA